MAPHASYRLAQSPAINKRRTGLLTAANAGAITRTSTATSESTYRNYVGDEEPFDPRLTAALLVGEYRSDVEQHMHQLDEETVPVVETMDLQPELEWFMRPYLIDFMIEIHLQYRLKPETLYLAVNIVDRYVARRVVFKKHYQLVGCAALWMAAKYEDSKDRVPNVTELCEMCCAAYEETSFVQMEGHVLSTIGWSLGHPSPEAFLRMYMAEEDPTGLAPSTLAQVTRFFMELSLFDRAFVSCLSADIAGGAMMLARFILHLARRPSEETDGARRVMFMMDEMLASGVGGISTVVVKKYAYSHFARASRVVGDWYGAGNRLLAPRAAMPSSITSSPTSSVLTFSSSSRRSAGWSSPGSSVKAEEEEEENDDQVGLQTSPSVPGRVRQQRLADMHPTASVIAAASKLHF